MKLGLAVASLLALAAPAFADTSSHLVDPSKGGSIEEDLTPLPLVGRPRDVMQWVDYDFTTQAPAVNTNIIYLNDCKPSGCVIHPGNPNSINDTWSINGTRTLTPFNDPQATWDAVVQCMHETFAPFGVQIVTVDPGQQPHFEIMIAGAPGDVGMSNGVGGISPFNCNAPGGYISNSLVFDFSKVWQGSVEEICSTAAQEVAHSFLLDHVTDPSDPLTYFAYNGRRHFKDGVQCGSDCQGGQGPFGQSCSGTNGQNHTCTCTGQNIQNDVQAIKALFGDGTPTPPTVKILSPQNGAAVQAGFPITTMITDDTGINKAELRIDGTLIQSLNVGPYAFNAPSTLGGGAHTIEVTAYDTFNTPGKASIGIVIGSPCTQSSECPTDGDVCIDGRCVAGPGQDGGLGSTCTGDSDCQSGICQADTEGEQFCVEPCTVGAGQCPSKFGCLATAGDSGVCWPGFDDGSGGGCAAGGGGALGLGLCLGAAGLMLRRPRRK